MTLLRESRSTLSSKTQQSTSLSSDVSKETPMEEAQQPAGEPEAKQPTAGPKLWSILIAITLVQFVSMLDQSIIATAIPRITDQFDSLADIGWYGSAYSLASAALQPLTGKLFQAFRVKWTFFAFFFVFELGSLLCAVATSSKMLIIARAIAGLGGSGLMNGGLTMVSAVFPKHKRPATMGAIISVGQLGQAMGPLIGGAFTQYVTWRWCFYINLPIGGIVLILLAFLNVPDGIERQNTASVYRNLLTELDVLGFVLFAPAAIMFFLALQYGGNQYAWDSAVVIGLFCGAGGTVTLFLVWEYYKGAEAMIPLSMLKHRIVWSSCLTMLFITGVLTCGAYYLPIYFQAILSASPIMSGVYYLPNILLQITFALLSGILVQRLGYYLPWVLCGSALAGLGNGLLSMLTPTYPTANRVGFQIIAGLGLGCAAAMPFVAVQSIVEQAQLPLAMAVLVFCLNFGAATFLTLAETIFSQSLVHALATYAPNANASAILAAGATAFRDVVTAEQLPSVLSAYSRSITNVFYLIVGSAAAAFAFGWGMGLEDVRKYRPNPPAEEAGT